MRDAGVISTILPLTAFGLKEELSLIHISMFFVVGGGDREHGYEFSGHHPKVRYDETSLASGAAAFACGAKAYLAANVKS